MEEQEDEQKQAPQEGVSLSYVEQMDPELIASLAMWQQEHERAYTMLETIESDSNEDEGLDSSDGFLNATEQSQELRSRWAFLTEDEETTDDDMYMDDEEEEEEDDDDYDEYDLDELTYEELIALGEFIGEEKRGLLMDQIPSCLHAGKFRTTENRSGTDRCVICQVEYEEDEELAALPCEHPYHPECITKWLQIKRVCPICGTEVSSSKKASESV